MDFTVMWAQISEQVGKYLPNAFGGLAILLVGLLVAWVAAAIVRAILGRTGLGLTVAGWMGEKTEPNARQIGRRSGRAAFYLVLFFAALAALDKFGLTMLTDPLKQMLVTVFDYLPQLFGAGVLLLLAWVLATVLRVLIARGLGSTGMDDKVAASMAAEGERSQAMPLSKSIGDVVYWIVFLLFLPGILSALELQGILAPVQGMMDKMLGFLPQIFAALVIGGVGWFVARIVQRVVSGLLAAVGVDSFSERMGVSQALGGKPLSGIVGLVVHVLILIPVLIAALNALELEAITKPASNMLTMILEAIPLIFAAIIVLGFSFVVGRIVAGLVSNLLAGTGFDNLPARLGLGQVPTSGSTAPSSIVGTIILAGIMLFAVTEACQLLNFEQLSLTVQSFTQFAGHVLLGSVILIIGVFLANLAAKAVQATGTAQASTIAMVVRVAILLLVGAMGLSQMGLADKIIQDGFTILLGATGLAAALAFGLGGRDYVATRLPDWASSVERKRTTSRKKTKSS